MPACRSPITMVPPGPTTTTRSCSPGSVSLFDSVGLIGKGPSEANWPASMKKISKRKTTLIKGNTPVSPLSPPVWRGARRRHAVAMLRRPLHAEGNDSPGRH